MDLVVRLATLVSRLADGRDRVLVAVDGADAAGKTTLARIVGARVVLASGLAVAGVGMVLIWAVPGELTYPVAATAMALAGAGAGSLAIGSAMIMAGTPPAKAGNAAAIEETAYDLGNVLGVATLGSVASLVSSRPRISSGSRP